MKNSKDTLQLDKFLEQLPERYSLTDRELIQRAYLVAEEAHRAQPRSGISS